MFKYEMDSVDNTYYANILNGQVDLNDPFSTFGCTPTNQNEGDNDIPQVIVPVIPTTKKPQRAKNFVVEEDMLLVSAWLNVSLDPVHGNEQRSSTYWNRIREYWMAEKKFTSKRSSNSLLHRWSGIQLSVNKFCGYMAKIEGRSQSGVNEKDRILQAKEMYQQLMGSTFVYEHCWHLLKDQPKWTTENSKKKSKTSPNASPASSSLSIPCPVNLGEDSQESRCIERPEGKKAAKKLASQRKDKNPLGGNAESAIDLQMEIQELRKQKLEHARRQDEQFQLMYVAEQEQLAIRREEVLIQRRSEDSRIMAMDTTNMLPMQAEYIIDLQKDILAKVADGRRNEPQQFAS